MFRRPDGPAPGRFPAGAIMGPLHRPITLAHHTGPSHWHSSLKETKDEASSPAANPLGDPLSTAPDRPERQAPDRPERRLPDRTERRPAARRDEGRAEGAPEGSASPRGAKGAGDMVVARPGSAHIRPVAGPVLAVDAMGGDYAPDEIVAGALAAQREHGIQILLTGPAARLHQALTKAGASPRADELTIVPGRGQPGHGRGRAGQPAPPAVQRGRGLPAGPARRGGGGGVGRVSTGGVVATARLRLRSLPGVQRPGLAVALPTTARPHGAHRRRGHRRPQAGDAGAVRPARRGLRPDRLRRRRSGGSGCSISAPSRARATS